jgi:chromosome segregation ATPase
MARESLIQMLEDLASRVRSLELEKRQAAARMEALERENTEAVAMARALEHDNKQAAATIQELEREKKQATLTIQGLEREVGELGAVIVMASEKVSEMLKDGATADISRPQAVDAPVESKGLEQLMEVSADPKKEPRWRSSSAFRFD